MAGAEAEAVLGATTAVDVEAARKLSPRAGNEGGEVASVRGLIGISSEFESMMGLDNSEVFPKSSCCSEHCCSSAPVSIRGD